MEAMCVKCYRKCKDKANSKTRMVYCSEAPEGRRVFNHSYAKPTTPSEAVLEKADAEDRAEDRLPKRKKRAK